MDNSEPQMKRVQFLDVLFVLVKWKKAILWTFVTVVAVFLVLGFFILPKWYKAKAVVVPPTQSDPFSLSSLLRTSIPLGGISGLLRGPEELFDYMAILQSRRSMEAVIDRFGLMKLYDAENMEDAIEALEDDVSFEIGDDNNLLEITTYARDSVQAADMANYFVELLNQISIEIHTAEAHSNRVFIEQRYGTAQADLKKAEDDLQAFQKKYGIYSLPVPELGLGYLRLYREVEIQTKLLEILLPIYEQAKIQERKDTPTVLVLDRAVPPPKPAKPRKLLMTAIAGVSSIFLVTMLGFFYEFSWRQKFLLLQSNEEKAKYIRTHAKLGKWEKVSK
ncbi:MAG TPA: GNVR domain-containing protein [Bacteroidota bacterium]